MENNDKVGALLLLDLFALFSNVNSIFTQQLTRVSHVQPRARTDVGNQTNSIELKNIYVRLKLLLIEKLHRCQTHQHDGHFYLKATTGLADTVLAETFLVELGKPF